MKTEAIKKILDLLKPLWTGSTMQTAWAYIRKAHAELTTLREEAAENDSLRHSLEDETGFSSQLVKEAVDRKMVLMRKDAALREIVAPEGTKEDFKTWCDEDAVLLDIDGEELIQALCEEIARVREIALAALDSHTAFPVESLHA